MTDDKVQLVKLNKLSPAKLAIAKLLWSLCPPLRFRDVKGIGHLADPGDVTLIINLPPPDQSQPEDEQLSMDLIEDPIIDLIESQQLGAYDGHGFDLESGAGEICLYLNRHRLVEAITAVQRELRKLDLGAGVTLDVLDYLPTKLGLHDTVTG